jgi:hypothetical protein
VTVDLDRSATPPKEEGVGFETHRLRLEPLCREDLDALHLRECVERGGGRIWGVSLVGEVGVALGVVGYLETPAGVDLICKLPTPDHGSPEYMIEALVPVLDSVFEDARRQEIAALSEGWASNAALTRLGFIRNGSARFTLSRDAWRKSRKPAPPTLAQIIGDAPVRSARAKTPRGRAEPLDEAGRALHRNGYL